MSLEEYIYEHFGVSVNNIPINKYTRFKAKDSHYDNCCVFNKGQLAWITNFSTGEKLTWLSDEHRKSLGKLNQFQRDKYFKQLQEENLKTNELNKQVKVKYINEVWNRLPKLTKRTGYLVKKDIPLRDDYRGFKDVVAIPMYQLNGIISGIQYLNNDESNNKFFKKGTIGLNAFYPIKLCKFKDAIAFYFVEGVATGEALNKLLYNIYNHTNYVIIVCFNSTKINGLVKLFKQYYEVPMIIVADNDDAIHLPITTIIKISHINNNPLPLNYDIWDIMNEYGIDKTKCEFINQAFLQGIIYE